MKNLLLFLLAAAAGLAAEPLPSFNATLTVGQEHRFVLVSPAGRTSSFLGIGETFDGYRIAAYDPKETALALERDGQTYRIHIIGGAAIQQDTARALPATLADAEALLKQMNFDEMMRTTVEAQRKAMSSVIQQSAAQALARLNVKLTPEDEAAFRAMHKDAMEAALEAIMRPEMREATAKAYMEVFSKQELEALSAFYATPAGQALQERTPIIQEKMMSVMMPLVIKGQQEAQQKIRTFVNELRTKYGVSPPPPNPAATPKD